jgi:hypothetical protein
VRYYQDSIVDEISPIVFILGENVAKGRRLYFDL